VEATFRQYKSAIPPAVNVLHDAVWLAHKSITLPVSGGGKFAISSNGRAVVNTEGADATVWDANTSQELFSLDRATGSPAAKAVVFSPDGKAIATLVRGIVLLNDAGTGRQLLKLPAGANSNYVSLAISPNGAHLATGDEMGRVKVWEVATGRELHSFQAGNGKGRVSSLAFSPDEKRLPGPRSSAL
jgi:WD40 repeat protein